MKPILNLVMRGRLPAIIGVVLCILLGLVLSPMVIASAAIVGLATLRNGVREGLLITGASLLSVAVLSTVSFQTPWALALPCILLWAPALGLAELLRRGYSLINTIEIALIGGWIIVGLQYLWLDAPAEFWQNLLQPVLSAYFDATAFSLEQQNQVLKALVVWMPGAVATGWFTLCILTVLLTLWAEATLRDNHDFAQAFRALRCSRPWLIVAPLLLIPSLLDSTQSASLPSQLYLVSTLLFVLQGLSLLHHLAAQYQVKRYWLSGLYALLVFVAPFSLNIMSMIGYMDGWWDIRARLKALDR